jgi:hypothetical protein
LAELVQGHRLLDNREVLAVEDLEVQMLAELELLIKDMQEVQEVMLPVLALQAAEEVVLAQLEQMLEQLQQLDLAAQEVLEYQFQFQAHL